MDIYVLLPFLLFFLSETVLLLCLYFYVLRHWIADHLEDRFREDEGSFLIDILSPAIENICDRIISDAPDAILTVLKHELLSSQGTLTRLHKGNPNDEQEVGLEMAEMLLKELGLKHPSAIMTLRAGKALIGMFEGKNKGTESGISTASLPVGKDLFQTT